MVEPLFYSINQTITMLLFIRSGKPFFNLCENGIFAFATELLARQK
jgi:hypothetical protein